MPDIKLRDGSGVEQTYTGVDTITVPLADGTGTWAYGLTDEELNFSGNCVGKMTLLPSRYFENNDYLLNRLKFNNVTNVDYLFYGLEYVTDLSMVTINCISDSQGITLSNIFNGCKNLTKLPTINSNNGFNANQTSQSLFFCEMLPELELYKFYDLFQQKADNSFQSVPYNNECYSLRNLDFSEYDFYQYGEYWSFNRNVSPTITTESFKINPWREGNTTPITNSSYYLYNIMGYFDKPLLKSFTFSTNENGTPKKALVKSQSIDFSGSYTVGYLRYRYSSNNIINKGNLGITLSDNIFTSDSMTIEQAKARYNELKNTNNWYSCCNNSVTYDGKSVSLALLFSRYNHDSAVETINSLPDTSEYLATAGGTNTIKFRKYSGACTDGGGTNDLTPEEIAVATAKGWTVTLV